MAYIFKYSIRSGTPASSLDGQVPEAIKEERNQTLLSLLEKNSRRRNQALIGTAQEVLVEGPDKKGLRYMGRTRGIARCISNATAPDRRTGAGPDRSHHAKRPLRHAAGR